MQNIYFDPGMCAKYCDERVCLSVCPFASLEKPHVQTSQNFLYLLYVAVARSVQYIIYFRFVEYVMCAHNRPGRGDANRAYSQSDSPGGSTGVKVYDCFLSF